MRGSRKDVRGSAAVKLFLISDVWVKRGDLSEKIILSASEYFFFFLSRLRVTGPLVLSNNNSNHGVRVLATQSRSLGKFSLLFFFAVGSHHKRDGLRPVITTNFFSLQNEASGRPSNEVTVTAQAQWEAEYFVEGDGREKSLLI